MAWKEASLSLTLKTLLQHFVRALPLLFPIGTKDEQTLVKIALLGRSARGERWSAKLKHLLLLSFTLRYQTVAFSLPHSRHCIRMLVNKLSVRVHLKRDVCVCLSAGELAVAEWLFEQFASLNLCKISCDVLVIQLRKQSFALLSSVPLRPLYAKCNGH